MRITTTIIYLLMFALTAQANVYLNAKDALTSVSKIMSPTRSPTSWFFGKTEKGEDCRISLSLGHEANTALVSYQSSSESVDLKLRTDGMVEEINVSEDMTFFLWDNLLNWGLFIGWADGKTLLGVSRGNTYYECRKSL